jgi:hypothetical protein
MASSREGFIQSPDELGIGVPEDPDASNGLRTVFSISRQYRGKTRRRIRQSFYPGTDPNCRGSGAGPIRQESQAVQIFLETKTDLPALLSERRQ